MTSGSKLDVARRFLCTAGARHHPRGGGAVRTAKRSVVVAAAASLAGLAAPYSVQPQTLAPTSPTVACPNPVSQDLVMPPEIVSSGGILSGTITLTEEHQRMPTSVTTPGGATVTCAPQLVRIFRSDGPQPPPAQPPAANLPDPIPGPTLRARVGELVQLAFVNKIDPNRFDQNIGIDACMEVGEGGSNYPGSFDTFPNCLHASSTANIHYHGTHTSPNSTADNVFVQVRPLPRDNQGNLTTSPADAMVGFDQFFRDCAEQLKNPLNSWPTRWSDLPKAWVDKQTELLMAYQQENPSQPLWDLDKKALNDGWPQYYIGAVPYCFALPAYTAHTWPPPPNSTSPIMGQSPGTHWYHAHKHGSTAINVANGMTGAFIIEGKYDDDLNLAYGGYTLAGGKQWNTRAQPILVLNQLGTTPNLLSGPGTGPAGVAGVDFVVNGRLRPVAHMQPGEIQLWRILNTSGRNALYFMAPTGFRWRQLAQDGVQLATDNYRSSENKPFYMAPGNRVDLLVQAPMTQTTLNIQIQAVRARSEIKPTPVNATPTDPPPGYR